MASASAVNDVSVEISVVLGKATMPIHQVLNLAEYDERAVSIHLYSKPYDRCLSYCRDTNTYKEVELFYTSIDGKLCDGIQL